MTNHTWQNACDRWVNENQHKKSLNKDTRLLHWLNFNTQMCWKHLTDINLEYINNLVQLKKAIGSKPSTINRTLALIKSILRKAKNEWEWVDKIPHIKLLRDDNRRERVLTEEEEERLMGELPEHLRLMAKFSLLTGQRASNVMNIKWSDVDLSRHIWYIKAEEFKTGKNHKVILNDYAINLLKTIEKRGSSNYFIFSYNDRGPVTQVNTKAFRAALKRANIKDFRWHDFRHTWASRLLAKGATLDQLQVLGGWSSFEMVKRYAHHDNKQLFEVVNR